MKHKKRKSIFDLFFGESLFEEWDRLFEEFEKNAVQLEGGYSISVIQTPEGTRVHVKAGRNVDVSSLRRELESRYPGAEIVIEGGRPLIKEEEVRKIESKMERGEGILDKLFRKEEKSIIIEEEGEEES